MASETDVLTTLYQQKSQLLIHYLRKMGCSHPDAEDIVQDTFVKAVDCLVGLTNENLSAWLFKVALNKYYDLCRKEKKYPQIAINEDTFMDYFIHEEDGATTLLHKESHGLMQKVFDQMGATNKNLLLLKYDLGLSYEQITALLGMNPHTVKTYLYRARNDFKKKWEDEQNDEAMP